MPSWSWSDYVARVRQKGYTVGIGDVIYKASELGKGRTLMVSKIEATWNRLHGQSATELEQENNKTENRIRIRTATSHEAGLKTAGDRPVADYSSWHDRTSRYELTHDGRDYRFYVPNNVMQLFDDEYDYRETANHKELTDYAVALFRRVAEAALPATCLGDGKRTRTKWNVPDVVSVQPLQNMADNLKHHANDRKELYDRQKIRLQQ